MPCVCVCKWARSFCDAVCVFVRVRAGWVTCVEDGGGVALAEDKSVGDEAFLWIFAVIVHSGLVEEEDGHHFCDRGAGGRVA